MKPPDLPPRPDSLEHRLERLEERAERHRSLGVTLTEEARAIRATLANHEQRITANMTQIGSLSTALHQAQSSVRPPANAPMQTPNGNGKWTNIRAWAIAVSVFVTAVSVVWVALWLRAR